MKTVKQILEHRTVIKSGFLAEKTKAGKNSDDTKIPTVIVFQRKAIRMFPDDQKIALYYSQALGKHVSIPFGPKNDALGVHLSEDSLDEAGPLIPLAGAALSTAGRFAAKKTTEYLAKRAARKAAKKAAKEAAKKAEKSVLSGSKKALEKGVKPKGGRGKKLVGAAALAGAAEWAKEKLKDKKYKPEIEKPQRTSQEYQFGRELGRVGGPGERATLDYSTRDKYWIQSPSMQTRESSNLSKLKMIAENNVKLDEIVFQDGNSVEITRRVAKKILAIYESLNKDNKKNLEKMLNEDVVSFRKVVNFAIRQ